MSPRKAIRLLQQVVQEYIHHAPQPHEVDTQAFCGCGRGAGGPNATPACEALATLANVVWRMEGLDK